MDALATALTLALAPDAVLAVLVGTFIGLVFGAIPGLTFTVALALVLPITFTLEAAPAIGLLLGTYIGGMTGGSVSAILLGIPGTPSAAATVIDGYELTRRGKAALALGTAVIVSTVGGIISLVVMIVSVNIVAQLALKFGPAEIFALVLFGLSTICGLAEKSLLRGIIAGVLGLMIMTIGLDEIDGVQRLTFGTVTLQQGVNLLVAMIALFAVPQVIDAFVQYYRGGQQPIRATSVSVELPRWKDLKENFWLMIRCSLLGTGIGAIPGTGGPIAAFLAYAHARRSAKGDVPLGKGSLAGVVAPEAANNAVTGGTMIPLLALGIPGDPATAIVLSGLLIHGLIPGPMLFIEHPEAIYGVYIAIIVSYIGVLAIQLLGVRFFVQLLRVPAHLLAVAITIMCGFGAFTVRNSAFDVYTMAILGVLAYGLMRARIPLTPIILGIVLGPILEREFRTALILSEGNFDIFVSSIPAVIFLILAGLVFAMPAVKWMTQSKRLEAPENARIEPRTDA